MPYDTRSTRKFWSGLACSEVVARRCWPAYQSPCRKPILYSPAPSLAAGLREKPLGHSTDLIVEVSKMLRVLRTKLRVARALAVDVRCELLVSP